MKTKIQQRSLTDCLDNVIDYRGKTPKKLGLEWCNVGYRAISANNVKFDGLTKIDSINCLDEAGYKKWMKEEVRKGDLLLTSEAPAGQVMLWMNDEKIVLSQRLFALRTKPDVYNKYLKYYLQSNVGQFEINKNTSGSTVFGISAKMFDFIKVNLPDYDSQISIGDILYLIDSKIELNNRINAELEAMAKTLYDYWFVQFDFPIYNQDGTLSGAEGYKTSGGKMVWNEELKREIPEGWEVKLLGTEIEIQRGISYTSKEINGDGIPMISLNSFNLNGTYKPEGIKKYSGKYTDKNNTKPGDLLIAATDVTRNADIIGRAILVPDYYNGDLVFSMDIAKIISKNIPSSFLMMLFNSNHYHNYIKWYASGTIVLHLNLDGTKRYNIELPPRNLLQKYDALYQPIADRIYKTAIENQKLTELRDWLLPMLMNGQVKVN